MSEIKWGRIIASGVAVVGLGSAAMIENIRQPQAQIYALPDGTYILSYMPQESALEVANGLEKNGYISRENAFPCAIELATNELSVAPHLPKQAAFTKHCTPDELPTAAVTTVYLNASSPLEKQYREMVGNATLPAIKAGLVGLIATLAGASVYAGVKIRESFKGTPRPTIVPEVVSPEVRQSNRWRSQGLNVGSRIPPVDESDLVTSPSQPVPDAFAKFIETLDMTNLPNKK